MSTRNKLLERIVLALGGTVTNPNNRNQLLLDWLTALGGPVPPTRLAPSFNGVSQYATIPTVNLQGKTLKFTVIRDLLSSSTETLISSLDGSFRVVLFGPNHPTNPNRFEFISGNGFPAFDISALSGVELLNITYNIESGSCNLEVNGIDFGSVSTGSNLNFEVLAQYSSTNFFKGSIYNLIIDDGSIYNYPMDDGWANNPTMRNTGTGADGTFVNMTEASWVEIPA